MALFDFTSWLRQASPRSQRKAKRAVRRKKTQPLTLERLEDRTVPVVTDLTQHTTWSTIQAAVTNASAGDRILADAGTYNEHVTINKSLTLEGAQHGVDARTRSGAESVVDGGGYSPFYVTANDVVIDGFTVQGADGSQGNVFPGGYGILLASGASGAQVMNDIIQNNIAGISLVNASGTDQAVIQYNLFQNNTKSGSSSGTDIYADQFTAGVGGVNNVRIDSNTFTNTSAVEDAWALGISNTNATPFTNITFSNNSVTKHGRGVYFYDSTNVSVSGNDFLNLTGNHYAIGLFNGDSTVSITSNRIDGGYDGLEISDDFGTANSGVTAHLNGLVNLTHASIEFINEGGTAFTGTLDASENYWGTSNPSTVAASIIHDAGPVPLVDFTPLLDNNESVANHSVVGFQADLSSLTVHTLGAQVGSTGRIQEGLNDVTAGGTVNVAAGTYNEAFGINQGVTLSGPNAAISPNTGTRVPEAIINSGGGDIRVSTTDPVTFQGLTLSDNVLDSYTAGNQVTFSKDIIANLPGNMYYNSPASFTLTDNHIYGTADNWDDVLIAGNWDGTTGTQVTITNNVIENLSNTSTSSGLNLSDVAGTISGNTFHQKDFYGVLLANNTSVSVTGNTFNGIYNSTGFTSYGALRFYTPGIVNDSITSNLFENSYDGIAVRQGAVTIGATISIATNTFTNNTYDIINLGNGGLTPAGDNVFDGVTLSSATTAQLFAIADKVVDAVDVPDAGLVRLKAGNIYVTPNSYFNAPSPNTPTTTPSIQRGIDAASSSDTVNVEAGAYPGDVNVNKAVTVRVGQPTTVSGNFSLSASGATLLLNPDPAQLTVVNFTAGAGTFTDFTLDNSTTPGTGYDQIVASGSVTISATATINLSENAAFFPASGSVFTLINNTSGGAISGVFANLADGSTIHLNGLPYLVSYEGGDGNDLTLTKLAYAVAEFPGHGVYLYVDAGAAAATGWRQLTPADASLLAVDANGDVVGEFSVAQYGSHGGVWRYTNATGWVQLTQADLNPNAEAFLLAVDDGGHVFADFKGYGLNEYVSGTTWTSVQPADVPTSVDATLLAVGANGDVAAAFPGYGVWRHLAANPPTNWLRLTAPGTEDASLLAMDASDHVFADFMGYGLNEYVSGTTWTSVQPAGVPTSVDATLLTVGANGDVAAALAGYGVWRHLAANPPTNWLRLTAPGTEDASLLALGGHGDLFADFMHYGVDAYLSGTSWMSIQPPELQPPDVPTTVDAALLAAAPV